MVKVVKKHHILFISDMNKEYENKKQASDDESDVSDCRQRPRHFAEDFSLKEAKSQYFQDF